jgi:hypothetical protein
MCRVFFYTANERGRYFTDVARDADIAKWFGSNSTDDDVPILRMEMEPNVVR